MDCIEMGYISRAQGLKGEVRAVLDVYYLREYLAVKMLHLAKKEADLAPVEVEKLRIHQPSKGEVVIKFKGIDDRNQAEELKGSTLFFPEAELPELPEGHFYFFEVIGYRVIDVDQGELGTVKDFLDGGAQDLLVMDYQGKEVLIPMQDEIVGLADHTAKTIEVALPAGLLELYSGEDS
ncbi:MAG: ribosome maturation factor RimM [Bacteroidota bacterium]